MTCNFCHRNHLKPLVCLGPQWVPQLRYLDCLTFLCDDRGHLFPHVKKYICKKTNHWGYPVIHAWDEDFQCCPDGYKKKRCDPEIPWQLHDLPRYFKGRGPLAKCHQACCSVLDDCEVKASVEESFNKLRSRAPPVVWILGHPHAAIGVQRKQFAAGLAKGLGYAYLDLESILEKLAREYLNCRPCPPQKCVKNLEYDLPRMISAMNCTPKNPTAPQNSGTNSTPPKYSGRKSTSPKSSSPKSTPPKHHSPKSTPRKNYSPKSTPPKNFGPKSTPPKNSSPTSTPPKNANVINDEKWDKYARKQLNIQEAPLHIQRMVILLKNVMWYKDRAEAFNSCGILEMIKMAFLCFPEAEGYVVDEFPVSKTEVEGYECMFWPVAAGVYFMSEKWACSKNRACNPKINFPSLFIRSEEYWEKFVDQVAIEYGDIIVKVPFAECLNGDDLSFLKIVISDLIARYIETLPKVEVVPDTGAASQPAMESKNQETPNSSGKGKRSPKSKGRKKPRSKKKGRKGSQSVGNIRRGRSVSPTTGTGSNRHRKSKRAKRLRPSISAPPAAGTPNGKSKMNDLEVNFMTYDTTPFHKDNFCPGLQTKSEVEVTMEDVNANEDFSGGNSSGASGSGTETELEFLHTCIGRNGLDLVSEEDMGSLEEVSSGSSDVTVISRRASRKQATVNKEPESTVGQTAINSANKLLRKLQSSTILQDAVMKIKHKSSDHKSKTVLGQYSLGSLSPQFSQIPGQVSQSIIPEPPRKRSHLKSPKNQWIQDNLEIVQLPQDEPDEFPYSW